MKCACFIASLLLCVTLANASLLTDLRQRIADLEQAIQEVKNEQQELAQKLDAIPEARNVSTIGFFAFKTAVQNLTVDDIVTWEATDTNFGDGFSLLTSSFVCPEAGYYFFQFNLFNEGANAGQHCSATLVVDGPNQVRGHSRIGGRDTIVLTVSQSALIPCGAGQRVTLQSDFTDNYIGSDQARTSSFNGFLVFGI